jgi:N-acetylglucosamine-6-phosphate deacetylase
VASVSNTLVGDFEKGGLKMIDIESYFISLKASWVSRLADSKFSNWKLMPLKKKKWINSGIFFVNDIIDNNGKIMQEFILHKLNIPYKFNTLIFCIFLE